MRKFGALYAPNLRNAPLANAPFLGFLTIAYMTLPVSKENKWKGPQQKTIVVNLLFFCQYTGKFDLVHLIADKNSVCLLVSFQGDYREGGAGGGEVGHVDEHMSEGTTSLVTTKK